ncbi:hypothetical protein Btru_071156 [Bulinus truncatus]|nr:hypothetical protein Btru_071156 [Bulinus truncatus]
MSLLFGERVPASESCSLVVAQAVSNESLQGLLVAEGPSPMKSFGNPAAGFDRDELLERIIQQEAERTVKGGGQCARGGDGSSKKTEVVRSNSYDECTRAYHAGERSHQAGLPPIDRLGGESIHPCLQLKCHRGCGRHHHRHRSSHHHNHHHNHHHYHQQQEASCPHRRDEPDHTHQPTGVEVLSKLQRLDLLTSIYEQVKMITKPKSEADDTLPAGSPPCDRTLPSDDPAKEDAQDVSDKTRPDKEAVGSYQSNPLSRPGARHTGRRRRRSSRNSYPCDDPILPPPPFFDLSSSDDEGAPRDSRPRPYRKFHHRHSSGIEWAKLTKAAKREGSNEPPTEIANQTKTSETNVAECTAASRRRLSSEPEVTPSDKADDKMTELAGAPNKNNENVKCLILEMDLSTLNKTRQEISGVKGQELLV